MDKKPTTNAKHSFIVAVRKNEDKIKLLHWLKSCKTGEKSSTLCIITVEQS